MQVLAAFDKFKDSLTAHDACELVKQAADELDQDLDLVTCPLTDGGEGFAPILTNHFHGMVFKTSARNSFGYSKDVQIGIVDIVRLSEGVRAILGLKNEGKLAIVEMASICGLAEIHDDQRNPWNTSTLGVGDLLVYAKTFNPQAILLGIGGSSTNDVGLGALVSLGLKAVNFKGDVITLPFPRKWDQLSSLDPSGMEALPRILVACDVDNRLLGPEGSTFHFAGQKGLPENEFVKFEDSIKDLLKLYEKACPQTIHKADFAGSGAAGGIAFGLSVFYDVQFIRGAELVSQWLGLDSMVSRSNLVVTGEGRFDRTSFKGKGPFEILKIANKKNKESLLICGSIDPSSRKEILDSFPLCRIETLEDSSLSLEENLRAAPNALKSLSKKVLGEKAESRLGSILKETDNRYKRIRRLKKFLRPLPRRSNIHKYPILKWFAETAYKRSYLWSFRGKEIQRALFWGIWIALLPIVGIQMLVVFFLALCTRSNLPLIVALQWISNPFTMGPIYFADYKIGKVFLELLGVNIEMNNLLSPQYDWSKFSFKELLRIMDAFPPMFVGGSVLGISLGVTAVFLYKFFSKFYKQSYVSPQAN